MVIPFFLLIFLSTGYIGLEFVRELPELQELEELFHKIGKEDNILCTSLEHSRTCFILFFMPKGDRRRFCK